MKHMSIQEMTLACHGVYHGDQSLAGKEAGGVVIDSRQVQQDYVFVAIKGARVDGHAFIPQVMEKGALCAISEMDLGEVDFPYIQVASSAQALKDLAEHYRRSLDIKVVGITGSVGKTSTKEMIASVLSQKYQVLKTEGNFNNEIGLPLTVFRIREEHQVAVLEMGISHFGDMEPLARIARPDICVITNIGYAHLENLGSRDGILQEKTSMTDYMNPEGTIILNGDDDKLRGYAPEDRSAPLFFGTDPACPFHAEGIKNLGLKGTDLEIVTPGFRFPAHISIPGDHMVLNALAGAAVGCTLGMTADEIAEGIRSLVPIAGRNNLIETSRYTIIDDCYNANPASMRASLDVLAWADTRKAAILGDMFELGAAEKEMHYEIGRYAVEKGIDLLICIGELSAETARGAEEAGASGKHTEVHHYPAKDAFFKEKDALLKDGDTILVKASHGMEFPEIISILRG